MDLRNILEHHSLWVASARAEGARADLSGADLSKANLSKANLSKADLSKADLSGANLFKANLTGADLSGANLSNADLFGANLTGVNLTGANLSWANLSGASLEGTCLDPNDRSYSEPTLAGLVVLDGYVYGYRTRVSEHMGNTDYSQPGTYRAPYFSVCKDTSCHPGIYFASAAWLNRHEYCPDRVFCRSKVSDCIVAGDKIRTRELEVLG